MTGRYKVLLALAVLLLTQAVFARATAEDTLQDEQPESDEYKSLASVVASRVSNLMRGLLGGGAPTADDDAVNDLVDDTADDTADDAVNDAVDNIIDSKSEQIAAAIVEKLVQPVELESEKVVKDLPAVAGSNADTDASHYDYSVSKKKNSGPGRRVKSYRVSGNDVSNGDVEHRRVKRGTLGAGIPDEFTFTLEALGDFASSDNFKIGNVIPYRLVISASGVETDVQVEIFSELSGGAFFMISHVEIGTIGLNFNNSWTADMATIEYHSKFSDGRWDYATVDMGKILNLATETVDPVESQIEVLFQAQALPHSSYEEGGSYRVSVGAMYESESYVHVAQDDLIFENYTSNSPPDATFSITGPDSLVLGTTGVWTIEAAIYDLYSDIALDVLAPLHNTGVMTIDKISVHIDSIGENYAYSGIAFDDGSNFTRSTYENYGDYGRLNLGTIVNKGYHDSDWDLVNSTITFEVAITMLEHEHNTTHPYTVGFTLWKKDNTGIEIMWSAQEEVQAEDAELETLSSSPVFSWAPTSDTVMVGGRFAMLLNMSIPFNTSAKYVLETSIPVNGSKAMMEIERVRYSRIGFNMPHVEIWNENPTAHYTEKTDNTSVDFISWDLGIITNTGQRSGPDDDIVQFEITMRVLPACEVYYTVDDDMYISLGMKHAEDYYWVGRSSIKYVAADLQYNGDQVPEFTFVNVMGADAPIYKDSGAVFDLDMNVPPAVDYNSFTMEISTTNFTDSEYSQFRIVSMEILHIGKALFVENVSLSNLSYMTEETDSRGETVYTQGVITIDRLTSMRDENFERYSYEDSTIRIRTVVVARSEPEIALVNDEMYYTEVTVSFADSYIFAARQAVVYKEERPNYYTTPDADGNYVWQPEMYFALREGDSQIVGKGAPITYNVTYSVPYRTVTDLFARIQSDTPELQICRVSFVEFGEGLVDFVPREFEGDKLNSTNDSNIDIAHNSMSTVTSFGYGYYVGDVRDSYVTYEAIVLLNKKAELGANYSFYSTMNMAGGTVTTDPNVQYHEVSAGEVPATLTTLPEVFMGKFSNATDTAINKGGSELFFIDVYIPPGTQHYLVVNVFAPWNDTFYGDYELLDVLVISAGSNLPCYEHTNTEIELTRTSDNADGLVNMGIIDLGYLPSISPTGSTEIVDEANKLRVVAHVAVPYNSTLAPGDAIPIAATINIDDEHLWVGFVEADVEVETYSANDMDLGENATLEIFADGDRLFSVGEIQHFIGLMVLPPGSAYSQFAINLESQLDLGESRLKIFNVSFVTAGQNMRDLRRDFEVVPHDNAYGISDQQKIDFKFGRNADISGISLYGSEDTGLERGENDNEFLFTFSVQMLDTVALQDGFAFDLYATVSHGPDGGETVLATATGEIELTIEVNLDDNAVLTWDVNIVDPPSVITQSTELLFNLSIYVEAPGVSLRFPSDVIIHYRVPHFSELVNISERDVLESEFTEPTAVTQNGLEFKWGKLRWENWNYVQFVLAVDPNEELSPGLGDRMVTIPVDVSWRREDKENPGTFDDWFTEMRVLTFNLSIPENTASLQMASTSKIKNCQITASSDDGTNLATNARPNLDGWSSEPGRGSPLFQNEYIQVDFRVDIKFTAVTIYPFNDVAVSRITAFNVQYSRKGVRWVDVLNTAFEVRTFNIDWGISPTVSSEAFVEFEKSAFVGRNIRILPQANADGNLTSKMRFDLHGYAWPMGSSLRSYNCPSTDASLKSYVERQILAVPDTEHLYACTLSEPGVLPYCSGTHDFGVTWMALDDNVMNLYGYDPTTDALYALSRDRTAVLRSKDDGYSWKSYPWDRFDAIESVTGVFVPARNVPFPLDGISKSDLYTDYGTEIDGAHTWTVSHKALHAYPNPGGDVPSLDDANNQVAFWGDEEWPAT